ncbi:MAG TPA: UvrD-helicase domain-containing protein [Anaeromyxobacteraceae bacterium]|nr:UvrD-helicase domain-containing protein [Anaeromyxobacteraceae bacterium]
MLDLSTLNPPQREAVTAPEGPLLVLAGAGSGKTRVIAHRVAWLLEEGAAPESILAVTFTNKAAAEMKERIRALAGAAGARVRISTFHGFGLWLLEQEHVAAGLPRRFTVCDAGDQATLLKNCMREVKVEDRGFDLRRLLAIVSRAKAALLEEIPVRPEGQGDDYDLAAAHLFPRYRDALRARRAVDFDDLIARPLALLAREVTIREKYRGRFRHVLVDEYQDTNDAQRRILELLCGAEGGRKARAPWRGRSLCAVGDDDQAIYGWRGAEVKNILRFERHFPGARLVRLEQNYRSTGSILECANGVIARSAVRHGKRLWTRAASGDPVRVVALADEEEEARFVASEICRARAEGRSLSDFAVLYRLNAQSRPVEEALREAGIPHAVRGGPAFFDRSEVRDVLAWLKVCAAPHDDVSLARVVNVPPRGIGDVSLGRLAEWASAEAVPIWKALSLASSVPGLPRGAAEKAGDLVAQVERFRARFGALPLAQAARAMVEDLGLAAWLRSGVQSREAGERRVAGVEGVIRSLESYGERERHPSLEGFLKRLALDSRDEEPEDAEGVTLLTLHGAKGLEFKVVFLVGCEEDLLPVAGIQGDARDLEEERRLAYVGITRARERLWMTWAKVRLKRGRIDPRTPSRFLSDLPAAAHLEHDPAGGDAAEDAASRSAEVMAALRARMNVGR